ncbi:MAG TPA: hypothetical protein ENK09_08500 [Nitrospirae bacterium]|nr:hypothetical protein [Nitrospirota bacterium]
MVRGNICYRCGREMPFWYVEEGDLTISSEKITCPYCGWVLEGAMDLHNDEEEEKDTTDE